MEKNMRNFELIIEYDGSRYIGWQKNVKKKGSISVQEKIEEVLSRMEGETIEVIGAARTEAGVHARGQVANFKSNTEMKPYEIRHYLNRFLPRDIAVLNVLEVPERFHASYNAVSYEYEYIISLGEHESVFDRKYHYYSFHPLDTEKMKEAVKYLLGEHDFAAFADNKKMKKSTVRKILNITIYSTPEEISITVHGDDFWPFFVRILVAVLMEVGYGRMEPEQVKEILESKNRELAPEAAEARGLFLQEVFYS
jgi:tRNA pseudouridine38-40 synthase